MRDLIDLCESVRLLDNIVYHATPSNNVAAIRQHGLQPSTGSWGDSHSLRIYLAQDNGDCYIFAGELIMHHGVNEVAVLEINVAGLDNRYYPDPDWGGDESMENSVIYTETPIPASAIGRVVETFTRDDYDD